MDHSMWHLEEDLFYQNLVENPSAPHKSTPKLDKIFQEKIEELTKGKSDG